jgi:hypothetical protein
MPNLDLTDLTFDPDFAERLMVVRRFQDVGDNGVASTQDQLIRPKPFGVVIPQADAGLVRGPDQQNLPRLIQIHTAYRLRSISDDWSADKLWWKGGWYEVNKIQDFSSFGRGIIQADASSISSTEKPPE